MGLDMYLFRGKKPDTNKKLIAEYDDLEEVAYWRKANAIHNWFALNIDGVDNCEYSRASKEQLIELKTICETIMKNKDPEENERLLPTSAGFFFGSQEYDEWYYNGIETTIDKLTSIIEYTDWENQEIYYHPWW